MCIRDRTYLHLMPLLQMPHPHNDGGYAVEDFDTVDPALGTNKDLENLTRELSLIHILGAQTAFIGKVGADAFGRYLKEVLTENKVDVSGMAVDADLSLIHISGREQFPEEGMSHLRGTDVTLKSVLESDTEGYLGNCLLYTSRCV